MAALSLVFMAMTFVLFAFYGLLASAVREQDLASSGARLDAPCLRRPFVARKLALTRNS